MAGEAKKRINWKRQALAAERLRFEIVRNWQGKKEPLRMDLLALGVAHEFNNILGAALGHAEWALETQSPEDMKDALEVVRTACLRCAQITKSIQGIVQPKEEGKSIFNLSSLFDEIARLWKNRAEKSGIQINFEKADIRTYVDASALTEILSNLVKNSFEVLEKHKVPQAEVSIRTEVEGNLIRIHYRDNGPGIPVSHRPYLFQPFFSTKGTISAVFTEKEKAGSPAESTTGHPTDMHHRPKGSGLGLFLSRALAQEMGGDLQLIDTEEGHGVHFELSIPTVD